MSWLCRTDVHICVAYCCVLIADDGETEQFPNEGSSTLSAAAADNDLSEKNV